MSKTRLAGRTATFFATILLAATCQAENLLLTQMNDVGGTLMSGSILVRIYPEVESEDPPAWSALISEASVGSTLTLDRVSLGTPLFFHFNYFLFNEPTTIVNVLGSGIGYGFIPPPVDDYHLSRITLSIDSWRVVGLDGIADTTVTLYGEPGAVPEPTSAALALIGLFLGLGRFRGVK